MLHNRAELNSAEKRRIDQPELGAIFLPDWRRKGSDRQTEIVTTRGEEKDVILKITSVI